MGANKLLFEVDGRTVLEGLLDALTRSVDAVVVVTGYDPDPITKIVECYGVRIIYNPDHEKGMTRSFQVGLNVAKDTDAAFLVLGDQVGLGSELLEKMISSLEYSSEALIVSPTHKGRRGHPVLFSAKLFDEILCHKGTLKEVVDGHFDAHRTIEGGEWSVVDFDTPSDFEYVKRVFKNNT
jgi:molybdenum cofactor cytidylyltransferase